MEKLPMCRICLVENVPMFVVINISLHDLYEKLTDIPFVTEDSRPMLACFFCCAKLKQCYRLLRQCLEAEKLFAQRTNEHYEPKSVVNREHSWFCGGFVKSAIVHLSIVDECQTESIAINEELPDIIEPKKELQSEDLEPETLDKSCLDVVGIPPHLSEPELKYYVPLLELKTEVAEEQEVTKKKQTAGELIKLEPETLNNSCLNVADIPPQHSDSGAEDDIPLMEFKIEAEEESTVTKKRRCAREKPRARDTNRTVEKKPKLDTQKPNLEDAISAEQTKKQNLDSKVIRTTRKRSPKPGTYFKEPYKQTRTQIGEKHKCDVCQRTFGNKSNLTYHIRVHTGEKPYKCDVCQRSFSQKCDLLRHIRIHTGEKPYKCDVCQRSFNQNGDLSKHIRIHTGEKPYKCYVCQRSFREKGHLLQHIRIHTGETPYKCDVCQRGFRGKNVLKKHIRIHTDEKTCK